MRLLFVHQAFPSQFCFLVPHLLRAGHEVVAAGDERFRPPARAGEPAPGWMGYRLDEGFDRGFDRGRRVAQAALELRASGFYPDVIVAHPGWGEAIYLKDVFERARLLLYCEWFFNSPPALLHPDVPYLGAGETASANAQYVAALEACDWGIAPTAWQRAQFPARYQERISVIYDGVDTDAIAPHPARRETETITFVARSLEPVRGFHVFMRSLPEIQRLRPRARILVVGAEQVSYSAPLPGGETYRQALVRELDGQLDLDRIEFLGHLAPQAYREVLHRSSVHIYATCPYVLSWSFMEAMAAGCLMVASRTPPVEEVMRDGETGLLYEHPVPEALAARVDEALGRPDADAMRASARRLAVERYDLRRVCLPAQTALIEGLAAGGPG